MSASSLTPPSDILINFLLKALAIDDARDVFPTPGGPTKHSTGPLASGLSCKNNITIISNYHFLVAHNFHHIHIFGDDHQISLLKRKLIYVICFDKPSLPNKTKIKFK
jgi:hypothetical protein